MSSESAGGERSGFVVGFELFPYALVAAVGVLLVVAGVWEQWLVLGGHRVVGWQHPSCPACVVGKAAAFVAVGVVLAFAGVGGAAYRVLRAARGD